MIGCILASDRGLLRHPYDPLDRPSPYTVDGVPQKVQAAETGREGRTPVHEPVRMIFELVARLSVSGYVLDQPDSTT